MYGVLTDAGVLFVLVPVRYGTAAHVVGAGKEEQGQAEPKCFQRVVAEGVVPF